MFYIFTTLGPVVQKLIVANPELKADQGLYFSCLKASPLPTLHNSLKAIPAAVFDRFCL